MSITHFIFRVFLTIFSIPVFILFIFKKGSEFAYNLTSTMVQWWGHFLYPCFYFSLAISLLQRNLVWDWKPKIKYVRWPLLPTPLLEKKCVEGRRGNEGGGHQKCVHYKGGGVHNEKMCWGAFQIFFPVPPQDFKWNSPLQLPEDRLMGMYSEAKPSELKCADGVRGNVGGGQQKMCTVQGGVHNEKKCAWEHSRFFSPVPLRISNGIALCKSLQTCSGLELCIIKNKIGIQEVFYLNRRLKKTKKKKKEKKKRKRVFANACKRALVGSYV